MSKSIRVIVFKEGDVWIGQGLEHDICVQASTMSDVYGLFDVAVRLESKEEGGLDRIEPAPSHFESLWKNKSAGLTPSSQSNPLLNYGIAA